MPKRRGIMDYIPGHKEELLRKTQNVLAEVGWERLRQDKAWGVQDHSQMLWLGILAEEFGEAAKEINELHFDRIRTVVKLRDELIQVAAVAVAMVESLDRNGK